MAESVPIRILIADDHNVVRMGLLAVIEERPDMQVVAEAVSGEQAIALYRQHRPDVVLMDLRMPGMDGIEAMKAIRAEFPEAHLLVLTTYGRYEDIYRALGAGALGYVLKSSSSDELTAAIRKVAEGKRHIPPAVAVRLADQVPLPPLSAREVDVLRLMCKCLSNREIADRLAISEHTIKNHVAGILDKLGVRDRTQAVIFALERGLIQLENT